MFDLEPSRDALFISCFLVMLEWVRKGCYRTECVSVTHNMPTQERNLFRGTEAKKLQFLMVSLGGKKRIEAGKKEGFKDFLAHTLTIYIAT